MGVLLSAGSYAQLISVLIIFVVVLGITAWVTKWMAEYQKQQNAGSNIEVIETTRIAGNKFLQIVRVGETYKAIAICKDTVTFLGDVEADSLKLPDRKERKKSFQELFEKAVKRNSGEQSGCSKDKDR